MNHKFQLKFPSRAILKFLSMGNCILIMCILLEATDFSFSSSCSTNDLGTWQVCLGKHSNQLNALAFEHKFWITILLTAPCNCSSYSTPWKCSTKSGTICSSMPRDQENPKINFIASHRTSNTILCYHPLLPLQIKHTPSKMSEYPQN